MLLNTDAFVASDTLEKTIAYMDQHPDCGVLGVRLEGREGDLQPCCRYFPTPLNVFIARTGLKRLFPGVKLVDEMNWDHNSVRECDWLPGCYYLVRREVLDQVGLFDPRYFLYYEEVEMMHRLNNGIRGPGRELTGAVWSLYTEAGFGADLGTIKHRFC